MTTASPRRRRKVGPDSEQLRQFWELARDAVVVTDPDGVVLAANPAYFDLYGYAPEEILGQSFAVVLPEAQREAAIEGYRRLFAAAARSVAWVGRVCADEADEAEAGHVTVWRAPPTNVTPRAAVTSWIGLPMVEVLLPA